MKKLKYYIPALAIVLTGIMFITTSCVDDSESQSVIDLRGAQAEKIKAEAALATAQAKAAEIMATAEAALKAAEADKAKAEAKKLEAEAAYQSAQTEIEKAKAEVALQKAQEELKRAKAATELAIKQAEYDLEQMKIQAEMELLNLQNALEQLKNDDPVLKDAINNYSLFIGEVNSKKTEIAQKNLDLTKLKALKNDKIASAEEQAATQIKYVNGVIDAINKDIAENEVKIANWNILLAKGTPNLDEEIAKLKKQRDDLVYNKSVDLRKAYDEAMGVKDAAIEAVEDFRDLGTVRTYLWSYVGGFGELRDVDYYTVGDLNINITQNKSWLAQEKKDLAELETEYAAADKNLESLYAASQTAVTAANNAWTEYETARDKYYADPTADNLTAMNTAYTKWDEAQVASNAASTAYWNAKNTVDSYPEQIIDSKNDIEMMTERIAELERAVAAYKADSEAPRKLEAAYIAAYKAMEETQDKYYEVYSEISALTDMISELGAIYYADGRITSDDIKDQIKSLEDINAVNKDDIAEQKRDINYITESKKVNVAKLDIDIAEMEAAIAKLEVEMGVAKKQADSVKAVIDARTK
ncbi:MAG: hypothetical protein ACK5KT_00375 [Dysgonomonas sp.]